MRQLIAVAMAVGLTACGNSVRSTESESAYRDTPPVTIAKDAGSAMGALTSVHMVGSLTVASGREGMNLSVSSSGQCAGSVDLDGKPIQLRVIGHTIYLNASPSFAAMFPATPMARVAGEWFTGLPAAQTAPLLAFCDLTTFMNRFLGQLSISRPELVGVGNVAGIPTVQLKASGNNDPATLDIAASAPHYILRFSRSTGTFTFSQFDAPVTPTVPPNTLNLANLEHSSSTP